MGAGVAAVAALGMLAVKVLDTPSRPYDAEANTVGNEYDAWTEVNPIFVFRLRSFVRSFALVGGG